MMDNKLLRKRNEHLEKSVKNLKTEKQSLDVWQDRLNFQMLNYTNELVEK